MTLGDISQTHTKRQVPYASASVGALKTTQIHRDQKQKSDLRERGAEEARMGMKIQLCQMKSSADRWLRQLHSKVGGLHDHELQRLMMIKMTNFILCCAWSFSHIQLFATPWTVARQAPPSMGFSRQEEWSGLPCPPPEDLPNPGIESRSPTLQADPLPSEPPGKPKFYVMSIINILIFKTLNSLNDNLLWTFLPYFFKSEYCNTKSHWIMYFRCFVQY